VTSSSSVTSSSGGAACTTDADCSAGLTCLMGKCVGP
jgi:hypothetical protein